MDNDVEVIFEVVKQESSNYCGHIQEYGRIFLDMRPCGATYSCWGNPNRVPKLDVSCMMWVACPAVMPNTARLRGDRDV